MKFSKSSFAPRVLGALFTCLLLAGFVGLAVALQLDRTTDPRFARSPSSADLAFGNGQLFSVPGMPQPGMPQNPASTPGNPAAPISPGGELPAMQLPPGQTVPGQMPPGQLPPGQMMPGQTLPGNLPPAPVPPQVQGDPKLAAAFTRAAEAQRKGDLKSAAAAYREVLRGAPEALPAHLNLAMVLLQQDQAKQAVWHLKKAVAIGPRDPQPRAILAQTYLQLKQPREAYEQWTKLAEMKLPDQGQAAFTAGAIAFEQLKKPDDAERWLRLANTQTKGQDPRTSMLLGQVLMARKKYSEANKILEPVAKKFSQVTQIQTALADAQWQSGNKSAAIATLRATEKSTPAAAADGLVLGQVRVMLGRALAQEKQYSQAVPMLKSAVATLPKNSPAAPQAQALLAQTLAGKAEAEEKSGNLSASIASWSEAANLFPDNPTAYIQRGRLYDKQGKDGEALAQYNRALKMLPREASVVLAVAELEEKNGNPARAMTHWKTLIETRPDFEPAYSNLARLAAKQKQLAAHMDYLETRLQKNPNQRAPYDSVLEAGHSAGRGELARDWVSQMAKKYPKASAPRNALIAFERRHPAKPEAPQTTPKPEAAQTPAPKPTSTPAPKPAPESTPAPKPTTTPKPTPKPTFSSAPKTTIAPMSTPDTKPAPALSEAPASPPENE